MGFLVKLEDVKRTRSFLRSLSAKLSNSKKDLIELFKNVDDKINTGNLYLAIHDSKEMNLCIFESKDSLIKLKDYKILDIQEAPNEINEYFRDQ